MQWGVVCVVFDAEKQNQFHIADDTVPFLGISLFACLLPCCLCISMTMCKELREPRGALANFRVKTDFHLN